MELVAGAVAARGKEAFAGCSRRFHLLAFDVAAEFDAAARIYRSSRKAGVIPTRRVDCMIASAARRHGATLLSCDADMTRVASVVGIDLDESSPDN